MSVIPRDPIAAGLRHHVSALRGNWFWFVVLGLTLVVLGMVALGSVVVASLAAAIVLGWLILTAGVVETAGSFFARAWSGFFVHLLSGLLSIVIGLLILRAPVDALSALTLMVAFFLMVGGLFKIIAAASHRFSSWGWPMVSGIVDVVLGVMIWQEWPASALWVIGLFLGINLVFRGANWVALGLAIRSMPDSAAVRAA